MGPHFDVRPDVEVVMKRKLQLCCLCILSAMISYVELYVDSSKPCVLWNDWNIDRQVYLIPY